MTRKKPKHPDYKEAYGAGRFEIKFSILHDGELWYVIEQTDGVPGFTRWGPIVSKALARKVVEERKSFYSYMIANHLKQQGADI